MSLHCLMLVIVLIRAVSGMSALANDTSSRYPCQHTRIERGWIKSSDCSGYFTISSMTATLTLPCSKLGTRVVAGPIMLDMHHCVYKGNGNPVCLPDSELAFFGIQPCSFLTSSVNLCTVAIICLLSAFNYLLCRFLWIRLKFKPAGTTISYRTNEAILFMIAYTKKINPGVKYETAEERAMVETGHKSLFQYRFTLKALLLLLLFFVHPVTPRPLGMKGSQTPTQHHIGTYHVLAGQELELDGWKLKVREAAYHMILAPGYKTSQCKSSLVGDWHCTSVCYNDGGSCKGYGPNGVIKKKGYKTVGKLQIPSESILEYCMPGTIGCFAANGCWKWSIHVKYETQDVHEVHLLDDLVPILEYDIIAAGEGLLPSLDMSYSLSMVGSCIVKNRDGKMWLCHECSRASHPRAGHVGDIQFDGLKEALIPLGFSTCVKDERAGPQCSTMDCALKKNLEQCVVIGSSESSATVIAKGSALYYTPKSGVSVRASRSAGSVESSLNSNCGQPTVSLWIIANSDRPAILSISIAGDSFHHSAIWQDPCSKEKWVIPCTGQTIHTEASWPYECYARDKTIGIHTEHHGLAQIEGYNQLSWDSGHSSSLWGIGGLSDWLHVPSLLGAFGVNSVVLVIVIILVCKR